MTMLTRRDLCLLPLESPLSLGDTLSTQLDGQRQLIVVYNKNTNQAMILHMPM